MEMMVILSQEHPELPSAELKSVLRSEGIEFSLVEDGMGYVILDAPHLHGKSLRGGLHTPMKSAGSPDIPPPVRFKGLQRKLTGRVILRVALR